MMSEIGSIEYCGIIDYREVWTAAVEGTGEVWTAAVEGTGEVWTAAVEGTGKFNP